MSNFFVVIFFANGNWEISRTFSQIKNARKLAKLLGEKWEAKIMKGGPGGIEVK